MNEYVPNEDWDSVRRNFERMKSLVIDTGGESFGMRFGSDLVTYAGGSQDSGDTTVTHGLGKTPEVVFTQSTTITAMARPTAAGATTFQVRLRTLDGSTPGAGSTATFYWLALG